MGNFFRPYVIDSCMNLNVIATAVLIGLILMVVVTSPAMTLVLGACLVGVYWGVSRGIEYINDRTIAQFAAMNAQLKIALSVPARKAFNLAWSYPSLKGRYLERDLSISMKNKDMAGMSVPYTSMSIDALRHRGVTLEISSETLGSTLKKMIGKQDVLTGDIDFDRRFLIKTNNQKFIKDLLDEEIRDILKKEVFLKMGTLSLKDSELCYEEQIVVNTDNERRRMENILLVMYMLAKRMDYMRDGKIAK
ncbi:MAG: hypothetical protein IPL33_08635 [Sphingobacteriales bacterium]|nr:hypothetical protein [Sphingobacteriales bacterium]